MLVERYSDIKEIASEWKSIQKNGEALVFQTFEWVSHWMEFVGKAQHIEPLIVVVREKINSPPLLILPFGIRTSFGCRILSILGGFHADYAGGVINKNCVSKCPTGETLWGEIEKIARGEKVDLIWVWNIPLHLGRVPNPLWFKGCRQSGESNAIVGVNSWQEYYQEIVPTKVRADSRRQRKRLAEIGQLRFCLAKTLKEGIDFTQTMIIQKSERYTALGIKNQFDQPEHWEFFLKSVQGRNGLMPHVSALLLDDRILAVHWGEVHDGRFYYLMPSHDERWEKFSPGRLLLEHLVEWSFKSGYDVFDFTVGAEAYKYHWANLSTPLFEYNQVLTFMGCVFTKARNYYRTYVKREGNGTIKMERN